MFRKEMQIRIYVGKPESENVGFTFFFPGHKMWGHSQAFQKESVETGDDNGDWARGILMFCE